MHPGLLLRDVEVDGVGRTDCRIEGGTVTALGPQRDPGPGTVVVEGRGGGLVPGLADHHLHLTAMAAHATSYDLAGRGADLGAALADLPAPRAGWHRVVGYDDQRHGALDRHRLDAFTGDVPTRVQHRSGALWVLNSAAVEALHTAAGTHPGIERDDAGVPTGRLWRADPWLRDALADAGVGAVAPSLAEVGAALAARGITHVTDATPGTQHVDLVADAVRRGKLPQHVQLLASEISTTGPRLSYGPVKVVVEDHRLPSLDDLVAAIRGAHAAGRPAALHCVTRVSLVLALAAWDVAGVEPGDRVEHAAVADRALAAMIAGRGLTVVTQPSLVALRGDDYAAGADPDDRAALWPFATLLAAGVRAVASSDAPYGCADPWFTIRAARDRTTRSGQVLGADEAVPAATTLTGLLTSPADPGGAARTVAVGRPADLVLLDRSLAGALAEPTAERVRMTLVQGVVVHGC